MSGLCNFITNSFVNGMAYVLNAVTPPRYKVIPTPQQQLDRSLSSIQNVLEKHKKQWQDGQPEFRTGERNWQNIYRREEILSISNIFSSLRSAVRDSRLVGFVFGAICAEIGVAAYRTSPLTTAIDFSIALLAGITIMKEITMKFFPQGILLNFDLKHDTFDANLQSFEKQITKRPLDDTTRKEALCVLFELERRFHELPSAERTNTKRFELEALRDLITKVDLTPKSRVIFQKMLLLNVVENGITETNSRDFERLKASYGEGNNEILTTLQYMFDHFHDPINFIHPEHVFIPGLTKENFPYRLNRFLAAANGLSSLAPGVIRNNLVRHCYQVHQQLRNFYLTTIDPFFFQGDAFEKILFFSPKLRFLFSEVQRLAALEAQMAQGDEQLEIEADGLVEDDVQALAVEFEGDEEVANLDDFDEVVDVEQPEAEDNGVGIGPDIAEPNNEE